MLASSALSSAAFAAPPSPVAANTGLEVAHGQPARAVRDVEYDPSRRAHKPAWQNFVASQGGTWHALWDRDTDVPLRIYGSGIAAPGAVDSSAHAEQHAWTHLASHLTLLAPGATTDDFTLVSNRRIRDMRVVGFAQHHRGLPVVGGQIGFVFKRDRLLVIGSQALPNVRVSQDKLLVSDKLAESRARTWIARDHGADARVTAVEEAVILPIIRPKKGQPSADISFTTAQVVTVATEQRAGLWRVYIDAGDGQPVAREQLLRFGSAQVLYNTPDRWPGGSRSNYIAAHANILADGNNHTTDADGTLSWAGTGDVAAVARTQGAFVGVIDQTGNNLQMNATISDGSSPVFDQGQSQYADAQMTTFVHLNIAKDHARILDPELEWLGQTLTANANIADACNAFFNPQDDTVNFFQQGGIGGLTCSNTGRLPDVIYHEFGHGLHFASFVAGLGGFDGAFSEGLSDYYAASITGDPAMGRGFEMNDAPLRHIDPPGVEASWPEDVIPESPHTTGLIFAQAMWDLRTGLIEILGEPLGASYANELFYAAIQLSTDIPSTYVSILLADDDDGDLGNGTPNQCVIDAAFQAHGLANPVAAGIGVDRPVTHGFDVTFRVMPPANVACDPITVQSASLDWRVRDNPAVGGSVPMTPAGQAFTGAIPPQDNGTVVNYRVRVSLSNGATAYFPANEADPMYELFVGYAQEIYCTSFDSDPFAEGWASGAANGADDWQWGTPAGQGRDPSGAYTGTAVLGNNLSGNYEANTTNYVDTPVIDVSGYDNVRLQYRRWLYVEDGYWDQATIYANGTPVWQNANSMGGDQFSDVHHTDQEWRFHDVDVTDYIADGNMQLRFQLDSDGGLEFGGWTIDDVCLVAHIPTTCGDGVVELGEECDDGNLEAGDGCTTACLLDPDELQWVTGGCCDTSSAPGSGAPLLWALVALGLALIGRRRRIA